MELIFLAVGAAFGAIGFGVARAHEHRTGNRPWGLPPALWGLIFFGSLLIGTILFTVAINDSPSGAGSDKALTGFRPWWLLRVAGGLILGLVGVALVVGGASAVATGDPAGAVALALGAAATALAFLLLRGRRASTAPAPDPAPPAGEPAGHGGPPWSPAAPRAWEPAHHGHDDPAPSPAPCPPETSTATSPPGGAPAAEDSSIWAEEAPTEATVARRITTARAAELLGVTPARVRQLVARGDLTAERDGRLLLLDQAEVEIFLKV